METQKHLEPKFSNSLKQLAYFLSSNKHFEGGTSFNLSRISKGDMETSSQFTGINGAFGNFSNISGLIKINADAKGPNEFTQNGVESLG
jgi:hypothetical protein